MAMATAESGPRAWLAREEEEERPLAPPRAESTGEQASRVAPHRAAVVLVTGAAVVIVLTLSASHLSSSGQAASKPRSTLSTDYNCHTRDDREQWSPGKKRWCCDVKHIGCEMCGSGPCPGSGRRILVGPAGDADLDCNFTLNWYPERKEWCCLHKKVGCEHHECDTREKMTPSKIEHCCEKKHKHCHEMNCNTKEMWSGFKREWCCQHEHKGCEMACSGPCPAPPVSG